MEYLIAIKVWVMSHIPAAIGSALSLYVSREKTAAMRNIELFFVFFAGILLAHYVGGAAIEYSNIEQSSMIADTIKLTIGLIGMAFITNLVIQLPLAFEAARKKWLG